MINVLFMTKGNTNWKTLINNLIVKNENLRICYIANTIKEFTFAISKYKIDIILVDVNESTCEKILKNEFLNKNRYLNSVILINNKDSIINTSDKKCICGCVYKKDTIDKIINSINILINTKTLLKSTNMDISIEKRIKNKIKQELEYIGYNSLHFGTKYLVETIYILYTLEEYYDDNLEKDIYPIIANKYGKSIQNIKCNIRNATDIMYYENDEEKIMLYLGDCFPEKPKSKRIILTILNKLNN